MIVPPGDNMLNQFILVGVDSKFPKMSGMMSWKLMILEYPT